MEKYKDEWKGEWKDEREMEGRMMTSPERGVGFDVSKPHLEVRSKVEACQVKHAAVACSVDL